MRNLKKILALVLALVMSLSLMATAGASSFSDVDDSNPYSTAIDVLDALKVFIGYEDGSFQPTGELTRAEAAVLVYRIATGDVEGKYVENYTYMANSKFNDLDNGYGWAKGYINYCQNAEIIKGTSATTFSPGLKVTGYQLMVMVLRTLGYDKAGEFSDPITWELESARKCEQLGMLKNIPNTGDFGNAAPRQMTAEILFRGLLQNTVKYSVMTPGGYTMDATTLGYQKFTLEEVTGVVVANEYADLHRDPDLSGHSVAAPAGVTVLDVNGEKFNINVSTKLEDLGESRTTYTVENGKANGHELTGIALADTGYNDVEETGEPVANITTSYVHGSVDPIRYLNFGEAVGTAQATVKFTYQAEGIYDVISAVSETAAKNTFRSKYHLDPVTVPDAQLAATASYAGSGVYAIQYIPAADDLVTDGTNAPAKSVRLDSGHVVSIVDRTVKPDSANIPAGEQYAWRMEVEPGATYTSFDQEVVQAIFAKASWTPTGIPQGLLVNGQVFRGTQVADDYSDLNAYAVFVDNCIKVAENHVDNNINVNQRGWWLKVVDNDGDGITDYVFQTRYTVAKVSAVNADTGALTLDTWNSTTLPVTSPASDALDPVNNKGNSITANNYTGDTIEVGDVVYYAAIDGKNQAWKCEVVEGKVETVNRNAKTVKLTGNDTVYNESAVHEHSFSVDIASGVANMSNTTNMYLYLDKYGNVAAFSQNIAGGIVLLTDGWAQNLKNGVEYAAVAWDRETKSLKQYDITDGGSLFIDTQWATNWYDGSSINSWNRIKRFVNVNCDWGYTDKHADEVHTILAYMETTDDTARLVPVDRFADVQRENNYPIRMIATDNNKVPLSTAYDTYGTIWHSWTGTAPYQTNGGKAEVRALANTVYYFVYHTTWNNGANNTQNLGASVYVDECVGFAAAQAYMTSNNIINGKYIEDVYTAATRAVGQTTIPGVPNTYYTANVVVVELGDGYYPSNSVQEQVFIYDFPEITNDNGNYLNAWESVKAIRADGTNDEDLKIDTQSIRAYVEATTGNVNGAFRPGLYYLERSYRTNDGDIWYIKPMTHVQIRNAGVYSTGMIDASYNPIYAGGLPGDTFWVTNWYCEGAGWHNDGAAGHTATTNPATTNIKVTNPAEVDTLTNKETSKYYTLSYSGNGYKPVSNLNDVGSFNAMYQGTQTPGGRWNQVLVRHDAAGNVVYAVSFAPNTLGSGEQFAQVVWRNILKSEKDLSTTFGSFYTVPFGLNADGTKTNDIKLTYADAVAKAKTLAAGTNKGLTVLSGAWTSTGDGLNGADVPVPVKGVGPMTVTINTTDGKGSYTYKLEVDPAHTENDLVGKVDVLVVDEDADTVTIDPNVKMTISEFIETVEKANTTLLNTNATIDWHFFNDYGEIAKAAYPTTNINSDEITYYFVTVTSEAGAPHTYLPTVGTAAGKYVVVDMSDPSVALKADGTKVKVETIDDNYNVVVMAEPGVTPVIVLTSGVYAMKDEGVATLSLSAQAHKWTRTLTADEVGSDSVIYIRAIVGGDTAGDNGTYHPVVPSVNDPATEAERKEATAKVDAAEKTLTGIDTETVPADKKTEFEAAVKAAEDAIKAAQALIADKTATKAKIDDAVKAAEDAVKKAEAIAKGEETTYAVTFTADGTGYTVAVKDGETALATGDKVAAGTELAVTVTAKEGYDIKSVTIGGKVQALAADGKYTYTTTAAETKIEVTAEAETPSEVTLPDATKDTEAGTVTIPWYNADTTVTKATAQEIQSALSDAGITVDLAAVNAAIPANWNGVANLTIVDTSYKSWTVTVERYWAVSVETADNVVGYVKGNGGTIDVASGAYLEKDVSIAQGAASVALSTGFVSTNGKVTITDTITKNVVLMPALEVATLPANTTLSVLKMGGQDQIAASYSGYVQIGKTAIAHTTASNTNQFTELWVSDETASVSAKGAAPTDITFTVDAKNVGDKAGSTANASKLVVAVTTGEKLYVGTEYKGIYALSSGANVPTTAEDVGKKFIAVTDSAASLARGSSSDTAAVVARPAGAAVTELAYEIQIPAAVGNTETSTNSGIVVLVPAFLIKAANDIISYKYSLTVTEDLKFNLGATTAITLDSSANDATNGVYLPVDATVTATSEANKYLVVKSADTISNCATATAETLSTELNAEDKDVRTISSTAKAKGAVTVEQTAQVTALELTATTLGKAGSAAPAKGAATFTLTNSHTVADVVIKKATGSAGTYTLGETVTNDANWEKAANDLFQVSFKVTAAGGYTLKDMEDLDTPAASSALLTLADASTGAIEWIESITKNADDTVSVVVILKAVAQ